MAATLPTSSYAGWGWGASMIKTEMVIFSADGDSSVVNTYYSSGKQEPDAQPTLEPCYTWTKTVNADTTVTFAVTRPLDCGIENSYVVQLDTELSLISAWNPDSPTLSFHGENFSEFTQTLDSDG